MPEARLALLIAGLVAAAVVVPYTLLTDVEHPAGALLFWVVFALAVIALIVRAVSGWKTER